MTRAAIRKKRKALDDERARLRAEEESVLAQMKALQAQCNHPKAFRRSAMGKEYEMYCPDCGLDY